MTIISTSNLKEFLPIMIPVMLIFIVLMPLAILIARAIVKGSDDLKPLITKRVKIIERRMPEGGIRLFCSYCAETETGERLLLRNFNEKKLIIREGVIGMISYRGKNIVSFNRIA